MEKRRRFLTIKFLGCFAGNLIDADMSRRIASILRQHADDIENREHVAGKKATGVYTESIEGGEITIGWVARHGKRTRSKP